MTLSRVTHAVGITCSRSLLLACPLLCLALAVNYGTNPPRLMDSPAFEVAAALLPMLAWGAMFGVAALVLTVGLMLLPSRATVYLVGLVIMCAAMLVWTAVLLFAVCTSQTSATAPAWPAFASAVCWATIRSLTSRETS